MNYFSSSLPMTLLCSDFPPENVTFHTSTTYFTGIWPWDVLAKYKKKYTIAEESVQ